MLLINAESGRFVGVRAEEHLGEDAAEAPDIDGRIIIFLEKNEFWRSIAPRRNVV